MAVPAPLEAVAVAVQVTVRTGAPAIEAIVDPVPFAVQMAGQAVPVVALGPVGPAIEVTVYTVAFAIQAMLDAITLAVEPVIHPVANISINNVRTLDN